jgi:hypothetical protein
MMDLASIIAEPARAARHRRLWANREESSRHTNVSARHRPMPRISASRAHSPHWALDVMLVFLTVRP